MKKLISILLTMLLIISALPIHITVSAEETNELESITEETGYSLNLPFYLNDQEARCFLGFLFDTRELTQEQITNGNAYAFLTGQLSSDAEIEAGFVFKGLMDAQLSRVVSTYEYGTEVGKQWILNYLYQKGHIKDNKDPDYAQTIVKSILKQISQNGIDYILDEYTVHGGSLQQMEFEYIQNGILVFDLLDKINTIPEQIDEYKKMMLALAGSAFYAGGTNRLEMYDYFIFCKSNMVFRHKYSEDIYQLTLSQKGLNEHVRAIQAIQPILAKWDFLDENMLLWGTEERMALMEKWADFAYCLEDGLSHFPKNEFVDEEGTTSSTDPTATNPDETEPVTQPTTILPDIDETHSGKVGDCSWYLNTKIGTLYILGSGAMANYSSASSYPWYEYRGYIKRLYIADGVTNIGKSAFSGCSGITGIIEVPKSVETIGFAAFAKTKPTKMILPFVGESRDANLSNGKSLFGYIFGHESNDVGQYQTNETYTYWFGIPKTLKEIEITDATKILNGAFYGTEQLETITLNEGITNIDAKAFYDCSGLKNAYYFGNDINEISISTAGNESLIRILKPITNCVAGHSISLNGDIGINYYIDVPNKDIENSKVTVNFTWTVDGEEKSYSVILTQEDKTDYGYKATCPVAVAEMTYDVTAIVTIDGVLQSIPDTYSAQKYAKVILNNENNFREKYIVAENGQGRNGEQRYNDLVTLVKTMLDYGTKAQVVFDRDIEHLANEGTDYFNDESYPISTDMITVTEENMDMDLSAYGLRYKGSTVVYLSETSIRHYYYVDDWDSFNKIKDSITFDGVAVTYTEKDDAIYFEKKGVSASNLDTPYTMTFKDKSCKYAVNDYIKHCLESDKVSDNTKALVRATYRYNVAANAFFEV